MNDKAKKTDKKRDRAEQIGPRRRLLRSREDRMVWGVAGGLAEHVGMSSILVRAGFVIAALFSGLGLLAYLVLAVAVPEDDGSGNPVDEPLSARLGRVVLVTILVVAALAVAAGMVTASAWVTATGHGTVVAGVVIALGIAVAAAAFIGDVRRRVLPWLIGAALLLALPAGAVAAADIRFDGSIGQREYRPTLIDELPDDGYKLGTGQLIVDLRGLPWAKGQTVSLASELGMGQMIVTVPSQVCVDAHATGKAGELLVAGDRSDGLSPEIDQGEPLTDAPRLELDAEVQFGQLTVTDRDPDEVEDDGRFHDHDQDGDLMREADSQRRVCGR
jgi:phage shock protein PspC (stress-responsive transcriptional regulator)